VITSSLRLRVVVRICRRYVAGSVIALVIGPCRPDQVPVPPALVRDSSGITIVQNEIRSPEVECSLEPEASLRIGSPNGAGDGHDLHRVSDASRLSDGRVAVLNRSTAEVRLYDANGRFLRSLGRSGDGPGEFRNPHRLWVRNADTIVVADYPPWRVSAYTPEAEYAGTVRFTPVYVNPPVHSAVFPDGSYLAAAECCYELETAGFPQRRLFVTHHDSDGTTIDTFAILPSRRVGRIGPPQFRLAASPLFEPRAVATAWGEWVLLGTTAQPELRVLDRSGKLVRIVRWNGAVKEVSRDDLLAYRDSILDAARMQDDTLIAEWLTNPERPVARELPAFVRVLVARTGELWIQEYSRGSHARARWLVFDVRGEFQCTVFIPKALHIFEATSSDVLGRITDELGIEQIVVYRLERRLPSTVRS
jgi:hypothetical protein